MKVEHIGIAVENCEDVVRKFQSIFPGLPVVYEKSKDGGMYVGTLIFDNLKIELMQPISENAAVEKFIQKRGEGIHHIAFEVDNITNSIEIAKKTGIRPIDEIAREGSFGYLISFLHPKDFNGVLVEFCQPAKEKVK